MGQIAVQTTKQVSFRGVQQEFNNLYNYESPTENVPADPSAFIDAIVADERFLHSSAVTFVRASMWSSGGTPSQNQMIFEKALSGAGNQSNITGLDRERAVLVRWRAGQDSRGRPVYLRKWFHSCGGAAGVVFSTAVMENTAEIANADRTAIEARVDNLTNVAGWDLCARSGRNHGGIPPTCHRYLEHHQLGDMWRG